jgi:hypothetical protein
MIFFLIFTFNTLLASRFWLERLTLWNVKVCKKTRCTKRVFYNLISDHQVHIADDDISTHMLRGTARPKDTRLDSYNEFSSRAISDHYMSISITLRILFEELESNERNSWVLSSGQKIRGASGVIEEETFIYIHSWSERRKVQSLKEEVSTVHP